MAFTAGLLALVGCAERISAQNIDQLVSKGGQVRLHASYSLVHTLVVPSNTQVSCDSGVTLSDGAAHDLNSVIRINGQNVSIKGCDIQSNSTRVIVNLGAHSSDVSLIGNHIHSSIHAHGILIDSADIHRVKIENNTIDDVGYGILQNVHAGDLTDLTIEGNTFSNVWGDAIELNNPVTNDCCGMRLTDVRASRVTISHNKLRVPKHPGATPGSGFCVGIAGAHDVEVSDNDCIAWNAGVHVEDRAYNIKIVGNSISSDDRETNGEQSAIWIVDGQHLTVSQNTIAGTAGDGIHLDYTPMFQASDIEISGNQITACGRYGLFIAGGSLGPMNGRIHDNTVVGCAKPIALIGRLRALSIHSNSLDAKNGCVFDTSKNTNKGEVEIRDNKDPVSGAAANATCGS
jgi:hypothetical protein